MSNLKYKIFHIDSVSERNVSVQNNKKIFDRLNIEELNCHTQNLSTFSDMENFIQEHDGFDIVRHNKFVNPFPHVSGVIGVWASNWCAWKSLLDSNADAALLLEDDVIIKESFSNNIQNFIDDLPNDWDVFSFCVPEEERNKYSVFSHHINKKLVSKYYQQWSAGGYIVSRLGAEKMIEYVSNVGIDMPIDWFLFDSGVSIINTYNPVPYLGNLTEFDDDSVNSYIGKTEGIL